MDGRGCGTIGNYLRHPPSSFSVLPCLYLVTSFFLFISLIVIVIVEIPLLITTLNCAALQIAMQLVNHVNTQDFLLIFARNAAIFVRVQSEAYLVKLILGFA